MGTEDGQGRSIGRVGHRLSDTVRPKGEQEEVLIADVHAADRIYLDIYDIQPNTTYAYRVKAATASGVEVQSGLELGSGRLGSHEGSLRPT